MNTESDKYLNHYFNDLFEKAEKHQDDTSIQIEKNTILYLNDIINNANKFQKKKLIEIAKDKSSNEALWFIVENSELLSNNHYPSPTTREIADALVKNIDLINKTLENKFSESIRNQTNKFSILNYKYHSMDFLQELNNSEEAKEFRNKMTLKQRNELFKVKDLNGAKKFIESNLELFKLIDKSPDAEELGKDFFDVLNDFKRFINRKIFKGDIVSSKLDDTIVKGKVKEIKEDTILIEHLTKGELEVEKDKTVKLFAGQKYDLRELNNLYSDEFNMNFKHIGKSDLIKLLKGQETGPLRITTYVNDQPVKQELIRLKVNKYKNKPSLNVIRAYPDKVYNKKLSNEEINEIKSGKEKEMTFKTKTGKEFKAIVRWDDELKGLRTKPAEKTTEKQNETIKDNTLKEKIDDKKEIKKKKTHKI